MYSTQQRTDAMREFDKNFNKWSVAEDPGVKWIVNRLFWFMGGYYN